MDVLTLELFEHLRAVAAAAERKQGCAARAISNAVKLICCTVNWQGLAISIAKICNVPMVAHMDLAPLIRRFAAATESTDADAFSAWLFPRVCGLAIGATILSKETSDVTSSYSINPRTSADIYFFLAACMTTVVAMRTDASASARVFSFYVSPKEALENCGVRIILFPTTTQKAVYVMSQGENLISDDAVVLYRGAENTSAIAKIAGAFHTEKFLGKRMSSAVDLYSIPAFFLATGKEPQQIADAFIRTAIIRLVRLFNGDFGDIGYD